MATRDKGLCLEFRQTLWNRDGQLPPPGTPIVRRADGTGYPIFNEATTAPTGTWATDYTLLTGPVTTVQNHVDGIQITSAGHGLSVGDFVSIEGTQESDYDDIWIVLTVIDANNFTVGATWDADPGQGKWTELYGCPVLPEEEVEVVYKNNSGGVGDSANLRVYYAVPALELFARDPNTTAVDDNNQIFKLDVAALHVGHGAVSRVVIVPEDVSQGLEYDIYINRVAKPHGHTLGHV